MEINKTGRYITESDGLFKHMVISEKELNNLMIEKSLDEIAKEYNVNFISIKKKGSIDFKHYTLSEYEGSIYDNGLICNNGNYIPDLGKGIYVIDKNNVDAEDNVLDYLVEMYDYDEKFIVVEGEYNGEYIECIYGYGHEGYIVLQAEEVYIDFIDDVNI